MLRTRLMSVLGLLVITGLLLAACGPAAQPPAATAPAAPEATAAPAAATPAAATPAAATPAPAAATPAPAAATPAPAAEGTYRMGMFSEPKTINYWNYLGPGSTVYSAYVLSPQRITPLTLADKTFALVPGAAEALPERPLQKEGEFWVSELKLKDGIMWSDGTPVTAKDVAFTANTALQLKLPGNWTSIFDPNYIERVEAVDDRTVKYVFKQEPGLAVYEYGAAQGPILQEAYWKSVVDQATQAVGALTPPAENAPQEEKDAFEEKRIEALNVLFNHEPLDEPLAGAFTYGTYEPGSFFENKTNPTFYATGAKVEVYANNAYKETKEGAYEVTVGDPVSAKVVEYTVGPHVAASTYNIYGDQNAALLALQNGDIDFLLNPLGLQRGLRAQVEGKEGITVIENKTNGFRYLAFNTRRPPMGDKAFRQAVAVLINKEFITQQILQGAAFPLYTFVPEGNSFWYTDDVPKFGLKDDGTPMTDEERVAKAIEILEAAGYKWEGDKKPTWDADARAVVPGGRLIMPDGNPVPDLELIAPVPGYDPLRSTFAVWIERYLTGFGIPVKANLLGFNELVTRVFDEQNFDMQILGWSLSIFPDYLRDFFHSERAGLGDNNAGGYSNPQFDQLADQIKSCTALDQCKQIADQIQKLLAEELPYVVLFDTGIIEAYRSDAVEYPYTETLGGLQFVNGLPAAVMVK
jgi:ABC-type transport system substrate-binding protein